MISSVRFVREDNGVEIPFNEIDGTYRLPMRAWSTELDTRSADRVRQRRHGIWRAPVYLGKRTMRFEGEILGRDPADYINQRLELAGLFTPSVLAHEPIIGSLYILLEGQVEEFHQECAIESWIELPVEALSPSRGTYQVSFKMYEPWMLGETQTASATPSLTEIGRTYDKTYDKTYGSGATLLPDSINVFNAGNVETFPRIRFNGATTSPQAVVYRGGSYYYFSLPELSIGAGDSVTVDLGQRTVTRATGENLYEYSSGDWWALGSGYNLVRFTAWEAQPGSSMEVFWNNAYML